MVIGTRPPKFEIESIFRDSIVEVIITSIATVFFDPLDVVIPDSSQLFCPDFPIFGTGGFSTTLSKATFANDRPCRSADLDIDIGVVLLGAS